MKPSHLRTPRTLSECYFEVGHYTVEPSMWQDRWNHVKSQKPTARFEISGQTKIVGLTVLVVTIILGILVQPLL